MKRITVKPEIKLVQYDDGKIHYYVDLPYEGLAYNSFAPGTVADVAADIGKIITAAAGLK